MAAAAGLETAPDLLTNCDRYSNTACQASGRRNSGKKNPVPRLTEKPLQSSPSPQLPAVQHLTSSQPRTREVAWCWAFVWQECTKRASWGHFRTRIRLSGSRRENPHSEHFTSSTHPETLCAEHSTPPARPDGNTKRAQAVLCFPGALSAAFLGQFPPAAGGGCGAALLPGDGDFVPQKPAGPHASQPALSEEAAPRPRAARGQLGRGTGEQNKSQGCSWLGV